MVYFARKGDAVIHHTDIDAMREWDGLEPEQQLTQAEFLAHGNTARLIDGEIFFGPTAKERADDAAQSRITEIDAALAAINQKQIRPSADIARAVGNGFAPPVEAIAKINALEEQAGELRLERAQRVESLGVPY
jgi:hypothetical protein